MSTRTAVAILAGGTGGHVMPALAVACELQQRGVGLHWFGRKVGLEADLAGQTDATYHAIAAAGLRGKALLQMPVNLLILLFSAVRCCWLLLRLKPRPVAAIGFGGYVSLPPACACLLLRIPLMLHEQNTRTGSVNRLLMRRAIALFGGLPGAFAVQPLEDSAKHSNHQQQKAEYIGNPVRREILHRSASTDTAADTAAGASRHKHLLILGGSQGAEVINAVAPQVAAMLGKQWRIHHLCGGNEQRAELLRQRYEQAGVRARVRVCVYQEDMAACYHRADLAFCRAGAMTLAELSAVGLPALLVPLADAIDNHQVLNAIWWQRAGAGDILLQADVTAEAVKQHLTDIHRELPKRRRAAQRLARPTAATDMAQRILQRVGRAA